MSRKNAPFPGKIVPFTAAGTPEAARAVTDQPAVRTERGGVIALPRERLHAPDACRRLVRQVAEEIAARQGDVRLQAVPGVPRAGTADRIRRAGTCPRRVQELLF